MCGKGGGVGGVAISSEACSICASCFGSSFSDGNGNSDAFSLSVSYKLRNSCQGIWATQTASPFRQSTVGNCDIVWAHPVGVEIYVQFGCFLAMVWRCWKLEQTPFWRQFDMRIAPNWCAVGSSTCLWLNASQLNNCRTPHKVTTYFTYRTYKTHSISHAIQ